jgi:ComF family protein
MIPVRTSVSSFFTTILDFVYPSRCLSCHSSQLNGEKHVCSACWSSIERVTREHELYRETLGKLLASGGVSDMVSLFVFEKEGAFQHIAHALKYDGFESLGVELGRRVGQLMKDWRVETDVLIPIPLHKRKYRERGYNQAELIAKGISAVVGIPVQSDVISRAKYTQTQTQLNLEQRKENIKDAFVVRRENVAVIEGRRCALVDDVITTGATISECAGVLKSAGAARVIAVSAALAK